MDLAAAQNAHRHRFTYLVSAQQSKQVVQVAYWLLVQGHDSVAQVQPAPFGRAVRLDRHQQQPGLLS
jgi:hypothetical protein